MLIFEQWKDTEGMLWWGIPTENEMYKFGYGSSEDATFAIEKDIAIRINPIERGWKKICQP